MILLFDDDRSNSNPNINKKNNIIFVNITDKNGMSSINVKKYIQGINNMKKLDAVFFDWDLTLSKTNGVEFKDFINNTIKQNLTMYFGTPTRQQYLKELFNAIFHKKAQLHILTRNGTAMYKNERVFFKVMMNQLCADRFNMNYLHYCPPNITKSAYIRRIVK